MKRLGSAVRFDKGRNYWDVVGGLYTIPAKPYYVSVIPIAATQCIGIANRLAMLRDQPADHLLQFWDDLNSLAKELVCAEAQGRWQDPLYEFRSNALAHRLAVLDPVPRVLRKIDFVMNNRQAADLYNRKAADPERINPKRQEHCLMFGPRLERVAYRSLSLPWLRAAKQFIHHCGQQNPSPSTIQRIDQAIQQLEVSVE